MTLTDIQSLLDGKCPGDSLPAEGAAQYLYRKLNEARSEGVGMFAADLGTAYQQLGAKGPYAKAVKAMVVRAEIFAQNVRKGAAE